MSGQRHYFSRFSKSSNKHQKHPRKFITQYGFKLAQMCKPLVSLCLPHIVQSLVRMVLVSVVCRVVKWNLKRKTKYMLCSVDILN